MSFNRAYSHPEGYDMRVPHGVPMGEIQWLREVEPFTTASNFQKGTFVGNFPNGSCFVPPVPVVPFLNESQKNFSTFLNPNTGTYYFMVMNNLLYSAAKCVRCDDLPLKKDKIRSVSFLHPSCDINETHN